MCVCCPRSPKCVAKFFVRVAFGGALALIGVAHFMRLDEFTGMVQDGLGPLTMLGTLWGYILPLLQIVGGVLIATAYRPDIAAWLVGIALASIVLGMPLKALLGGVDLGEMVNVVHHTFIWLLVYLFVAKGLASRCDKQGGGSMGGGMGGGSCCH